MGNNASREVSQTVNAVFAMAIDSSSKVNNIISTTTSSMQDMLVTFDNCNVSGLDISQEQVKKFSFSGEFSEEDETKIANDLMNSLSKTLKDQEDGLLKGLSAAMNPGGDSSSRTKMITNISQSISVKFTKEVLTSIGTVLNGKQNLAFKCTRSKLKKVAISQKLIQDIVKEVKSKNKSLQNFENKIVNDVKDQLEKKDKSEVAEALVNGLVGWRGAMAASLGDAALALFGGDKQTANDALGGPQSGGGGSAGTVATVSGGGEDQTHLFFGVTGVLSSSCCCCVVMIILLLILSMGTSS